jgi:hypothetical protein
MDYTNIPIREISTLAILAPILICSTLIKTGKAKLLLFFSFLLIGLSVDLFGWFVSNFMEWEYYLLIVITIYSIIEALFFNWWITHNSTISSIKILGKIIYLITGSWIIYLLINGIESGDSISRLTLFDVFYQISVSFLAGFSLLILIENDANVKINSAFWILLGIFFYCFGTFFIFVIKLTVQRELADQLWPLHNVVNIATYGLYSVGLWKLRPSK